MRVTNIRPIPSLVMNAYPTNFVGKIGATDVRIWQAITPDDTNFLMAVAMLVPIEEITDYGLAVELETNLDMHAGGLADAFYVLQQLQARPDGKIRDGDPPAVKRKKPTWWQKRQMVKRATRGL